MNFRNKLVYGIAGILGFVPLFILVIIQSIFALEATYDSTITIDAEKQVIVDMLVYDNYNRDITSLFYKADDEGKPILWSIEEAADTYVLLELHSGEIDEDLVTISSIQFELDDGTKTELLNGVVYIKFENTESANVWLASFIDNMNDTYEAYYKQPAGTISFVWVKIISASIGTILGLVTVLFIVLRKSTKALVKRYWRISVLIALVQGTMILGLITWIIADILQVFGAATLGWAIFLGVEKLAKIKGYLEVASTSETLSPDLPTQHSTEIETAISNVLAKYKR